MADVRVELSEKGFIEQNLLAWGRIKVFSFTNHQMIFFGIKDDALMILPFIDFKNISFNEVKYYTKESIKNIKYSSFTSILQIEFGNGSSIKYSLMQGSKSEMQKIVSMFNS